MKRSRTGKWEKRRRYRGIVLHVFDDNLHVVVREDLLALKLRFRVFVYSRKASQHASLEEARLQVLRRLVALAKE